MTNWIQLFTIEKDYLQSKLWRVTSRPHHLMKTSSTQSKRHDLHPSDDIVRQTFLTINEHCQLQCQHQCQRAHYYIWTQYIQDGNVILYCVPGEWLSYKSDGWSSYLLGVKTRGLVPLQYWYLLGVKTISSQDVILILFRVPAPTPALKNYPLWWSVHLVSRSIKTDLLLIILYLHVEKK